MVPDCVVERPGSFFVQFPVSLVSPSEKFEEKQLVLIKKIM
jgi:hypothetical protein